MTRVYLDHNASSPVHPLVIEEMLPYFSERFGNPSSGHWAGSEASETLARARARVASLINSEPDEIVFTSGGSEGDNLAIRGVLGALMSHGKKHIITTAVEHAAVFGTCRMLHGIEGIEVTVVPVDGKGRLDPEDVRKAIRPDTALVSVMLANNETGNIMPVKAVSDITRSMGVLLHTDAVQAVGKIPVDVTGLGVDLLTASGHKFNAPKGVGFQYVKRGVHLISQITGGGQEGGRRAGTQNIPGIAALGKACEVAASGMEKKAEHLGALRDILEKGMLDSVPETVVNGDIESRIYNTSNISFRYIEGDALIDMLDMHGIAVSTGSACSSGGTEPSRVLSAMGLDPVVSRGALRFSLGLGTTQDDIDYCLEVLPGFARKLLDMSPFVKRR